jgi:hypothetical protein
MCRQMTVKVSNIKFSIKFAHWPPSSSVRLCVPAKPTVVFRSCSVNAPARCSSCFGHWNWTQSHIATRLPPHSWHSRLLFVMTSQLRFCWGIIAVCSEINTKTARYSLRAERRIVKRYPLSCQRGEYGELLIMPADGRWDLTRRLTLILLMWKIWRAPNNASRWQMGFNSAFNPYPANVENMVSS